MNISGVPGSDRAYRKAFWLLSLVLAAGLCLPGARADDDLEMPVYTQPCRGAPVTRIGVGTRGNVTDLPTVQVLAPDHTGHTSRSQPVLFWYLASSLPVQVDFTLTPEVVIEPLMEARLEIASGTGIQRIQLADYDFRLEPGVSYRWTVMLVPDAEQAAGTVYSSAVIRRVLLPEDEKEELESVGGEERVSAYAAAGLWYDSLESVTESVQADKTSIRLQQVWQSLLQQADLSIAASVPGN